MEPQPQDIRRPDGQGRIVIGKQYKDETFSVEPQSNGDILLRPVVVIPKREAWLYGNPEAAASVERGLAQLKQGELHDLGDFSKFADDEID